jgi:aminoglycoside phosphotransferase (APT) family kinase protein
MTMPSGTVLSRSLASDLAVGSNRRGDVSGAGWLYALPRLAFERVVCVGSPPLASLAALVAAGSSITIIEPSERVRQRVEAQVRRGGWAASLRTVLDDGALADGAPIDLLVVAAGRLVGSRRAQVGRLLGGLAADGVAFLPGEARRIASVVPSGCGTLALALTPIRGEVRSVVPAADIAMRATIHRLGLEGSALPHPRLMALARRLSPLARRLSPLTAGAHSGRVRRTGLLAGDPAATSGEVPRYVRDLARAGGRDLSGWGWGIAARGDYDSQKVLILLRPPGAASPTGLVKVTRSGRHAARLENEGQALERLTSLPVAAGRVPEPWFAGRHADRALLGESAIDGAFFASRARWNAGCPHLADALAWLTELGAATRHPVPAGTVATSLFALLDRYEAIYRPPASESEALHDRFAALAWIDDPIPTVLQHGDPGIWNLLVDPAGRTVFLDWEASERDGLPLWDLLYLFRSYAVATSRRAGTRDGLAAASRHLLDASPLGDRLVTAVDEYRERVGVPAGAVEALIYGCWVHRSLKEATRMAPERLAEGQFVRLIRRMLTEPDAPTLGRLVGARA